MTKYTFGVWENISGGHGFYDKQNLTKLEANTLAEAKEEAKRKSPHHKFAIFIFEGDTCVSMYNTVGYRNRKRVIRRRWIDLGDEEFDF